MLLRRGSLGSGHPTHFAPPTPHTCWPHGCCGGEQGAAILGVNNTPHTFHTCCHICHTCWPQGRRRGEQRAAASRVLGVMFADGEGVVPAARDVQDALAIDGRHNLSRGVQFEFEFKQRPPQKMCRMHLPLTTATTWLKHIQIKFEFQAPGASSKPTYLSKHPPSPSPPPLNTHLWRATVLRRLCAQLPKAALAPHHQPRATPLLGHLAGGGDAACHARDVMHAARDLSEVDGGVWIKVCQMGEVRVATLPPPNYQPQ